MSEKIPLQNQEIAKNNHESEIADHERESNKNETHQEAAEHKNRESIDQLVKKAEREAKSTSDYVEQTKNESKEHPALVNKQLKDMAYSRALVRVRKHLSYPSRLFSKAVHSKMLDKPSEALGKTVARPSGLLGGAFFALIGTSLLLWITKKYGYEYNYLAAFLLFAAGMIAGLGVEGLYRLVKRR